MEKDYLTLYQDRLRKLAKILGLRPKNEVLYLQALAHRSFLGDHPDWPYGDNERLEFLGDAVLSAVISHLLFERYGQEFREGELTKMRAWLVNEERLAKMAERIGLAELVLLSEGERRTEGHRKHSILAGTLEAVFAAVYLDQGYERLFALLKRLFSRLLPHAPRGLLSDHKTVLQEYTQAVFKQAPAYEIIKETGPEHAKTFWVVVKLGKEVLAQGRGRSKKAAEQDAAQKALKILEEKYGRLEDQRGKKSRR
ncbi:MAG: ribonuclease III [Thermodesulfobacteria bacterium]|nr:ribonuclease III [Thermodesulfobacteriota bacterium]